MLMAACLLVGQDLCIDCLFLADQATLRINLYDLYTYILNFPQQMIKNGRFILSDYMVSYQFLCIVHKIHHCIFHILYVVPGVESHLYLTK
jgi:hypothetical protein